MKRQTQDTGHGALQDENEDEDENTGHTQDAESRSQRAKSVNVIFSRIFQDFSYHFISLFLLSFSFYFWTPATQVENAISLDKLKKISASVHNNKIQGP